MISYAIDEFWTAAQGCSLIQLLVGSVPRKALDGRHGYFLLAKPGGLK
jgi:hypothetical protein